MEQQEQKHKGRHRSETAPEEGNASPPDKLSDVKNVSDVLKSRTDVAKRAMDYADANAGDFDED